MELFNTKNEISNKMYEYQSEKKKNKIELQKVNNELKDQISKNESIAKELENYKKINSQILEKNSTMQKKINEYINNNKDENNLAQKKEELNQVIEKKDQEIKQL